MTGRAQRWRLWLACALVAAAAAIVALVGPGAERPAPPWTVWMTFAPDAVAAEVDATPLPGPWEFQVSNRGFDVHLLEALGVGDRIALALGRGVARRGWTYLWIGGQQTARDGTEWQRYVQVPDSGAISTGSTDPRCVGVWTLTDENRSPRTVELAAGGGVLGGNGGCWAVADGVLAVHVYNSQVFSSRGGKSVVPWTCAGLLDADAASFRGGTQDGSWVTGRKSAR